MFLHVSDYLLFGQVQMIVVRKPDILKCEPGSRKFRRFFIFFLRTWFTVQLSSTFKTVKIDKNNSKIHVFYIDEKSRREPGSRSRQREPGSRFDFLFHMELCSPDSRTPLQIRRIGPLTPKKISLKPRVAQKFTSTGFACVFASQFSL